MRSSFDMLFWLLADQLASVDAAAVVPSNKQRHLLHAALCRLVPFSHDQMLSQLLLQLLLLSYCIPSPAELKKGSPDTCAFLNMLTHAVVKASQAAPGVILFVEVQLSFVIASANPTPQNALCMSAFLFSRTVSQFSSHLRTALPYFLRGLYHPCYVQSSSLASVAFPLPPSSPPGPPNVLHQALWSCQVPTGRSIAALAQCTCGRTNRCLGSATCRLRSCTAVSAREHSVHTHPTRVRGSLAGRCTSATASATSAPGCRRVYVPESCSHHDGGRALSRPPRPDAQDPQLPDIKATAT